jgi:hypothetical protein
MTMAWIAIGITVAATANSIYSQQQAAKAQAKVQDRASQAERERLLQQMTGERIQQAFDNEARAAEMAKASTKAREARATAVVAAGESGVSGLSVQALLDDYSRQEGAFRYGLQRQGEQQDVATEMRIKSGQMQSYNNLLSINKPIAQVDYLGSTLEGAKTGMSVYSAGKDFGFGSGTPATKTTSSAGLGASDLPFNPSAA